MESSSSSSSRRAYDAVGKYAASGRLLAGFALRLVTSAASMVVRKPRRNAAAGAAGGAEGGMTGRSRPPEAKKASACVSVHVVILGSIGKSSAKCVERRASSRSSGMMTLLEEVPCSGGVGGGASSRAALSSALAMARRSPILLTPSL